jgi:hypothetical protein
MDEIASNQLMDSWQNRPAPPFAVAKLNWIDGRAFKNSGVYRVT